MADRVQNRPMMHGKPLIIDYVIYAYGLFSCNARILHTSIWQPKICIWRLSFYQLLFLGPFPKILAPKKGLQGPLWPSSKIFWLKHWFLLKQLLCHSHSLPTLGGIHNSTIDVQLVPNVSLSFKRCILNISKFLISTDK